VGINGKVLELSVRMEGGREGVGERLGPSNADVSEGVKARQLWASMYGKLLLRKGGGSRKWQSRRTWDGAEDGGISQRNYQRVYLRGTKGCFGPFATSSVWEEGGGDTGIQ
jgi:hypothetical protein